MKTSDEGYKYFKSRPSNDDAPDTCQYRDCDNPTRYYVKFRKPTEYVCFCTDHSKEAYNRDYARVRHRLS